MFLEPLPKGPFQLTYLLLFTVSMGKLKSVDYPIFLGDVILVPERHQDILDGVALLRYTQTSTLPHTYLRISLSLFV